MPRVRRKGNTPRFRSEAQRRIWEIVQDLHAQRAANSEGPWSAPKTVAGALAAVQFKREMEGEKSCRE
jgi:hypothetical protein